MIFGAPVYLLFLLVLPIIVVLHLVRRQRRRVVVSSTLLWEEVRREFRHRFFFERILRNLLLLLQLLLVIILVGAMADPTIPGRAGDEDADTLFLFDTSASMGAVSDGESRLARARREALDILETTSSRARFAIAVAHRRVELMNPGTVDARDAEAIISALEPTASEGAIFDQLSDVLSASPEVERVIVFTDLAFESTSSPAVREIEVIDVSDDAENAGITLFSFRKPINRRNDYELLVRVASFFSRPTSVPLSVDVDGFVLWESTIELAPGEQRSIVVPYDGPAPSIATAVVGKEDALAIDNRAYAVFNPDRYLTILLVSPGNYFLEQALASHPGTVVERSNDRSSWDESLYDIVVFDRTPPPPLPSGRYLLFGTVPPYLGAESAQRLEAPVITGWIADHPLLANLDLADLSIYQAIRMQRSAVQSIVHAGEWSLMWVDDGPGVRIVATTFDVADTDLPMRAEFPMFVANAISWLLPLSGSHSPALAGGEPLTGVLGEPVDEAIDTAVVTLPGGIEVQVRLDRGEFSFYDTNLQGIYRVSLEPDLNMRGARSERVFAVNVGSVTETNIRPRSEEPAILHSVDSDDPETDSNGDGDGDGDGSDTQERRDIWRALAIIATLVIVGEWLLWRRREGSR